MSGINLGKKWNYVKDVWMDGCDAPFTVFAETAFPAAMHAALSYYCLDPIQIFTGWVRPGSPFKGYRKGSHGKGTRWSRDGNKFWRSFKKAFNFDPNDWLAKQMPWAEDMERRQVPGGTRYMWMLYGGIERFNNYLFLYALTENFFYEWAAGIARSSYCQTARASVFYATSATDAHLAILGRTPAVIHDVLKLRRVFFNGGNGCLPEARRFQVNFSCKKITRWDGDPDVSECQLIILISDQPPIVMPPDSQGIDVMVAAQSITGGTVSFEFGGPHSFWAEELVFSVHGNDPEPAPMPEGWCNDLAKKAINWATRRTD